jgi:hypothetical protein
MKYRVLLGLAMVVMLWAVRAEASCSTSPEPGHWKNDDANTQSLTRIELRFVCQDQILNGEPYPPGPAWYVHAFGKGEPSDCDWGEVGGQRQEGGYVYAIYDQGFAKRFVWARMSKTHAGELWVYVWTDFADSGRSDYAVQAWFHRE